MYLSRVELDIKNRKTLKALHSLSIFHGAVESSFDQEERKRHLWRIDQLNGKYYLLLVSEDKPHLEVIAEQFGEAPYVYGCKEYQHYIDRIKNGDLLQFRLTANPTHSVKKENSKRGTVYAHVTPEYQKNWLIKKGEKCGFTLDDNDFEVIESQWHSFFKKQERGKRVSLVSAVYEGKLRVTDADQFKQALVLGIGREKAYGMGMLTVIPLKNE